MTTHSPVPDSPQIAERLRTLRASRKLTQTQVAEAIGVQRRTYGYWEDEQTLPAANHVLALADYYEVSADYVLGRADEPNGLTPGQWIIDTATHAALLRGDKAADDGVWAIQIPARARIVPSSVHDTMRDELRARRRKKKGST